MIKELSIGTLALALTLGLVGTASAQQTQDSDVTVDIASDVAIDVRPSTLSYTASGDEGALSPGTKRRISDGDFEHIELENIGSETLDNIYIEASTAVNNSFGNQSANNHDTGNFVTVSTQTADTGSYDIGGLQSLTDHHYINRVEFFEDNPPTYIQTEPSGSTVDVDGTQVDTTQNRVGRFRVGGAEYFFVLYSDDFGSPSNIGLRVGQTPHTSTQIGTTDFRGDTGDWYESEISTLNPGGSAYFDGSFSLVSFNESNYDGGTILDATGGTNVAGTNEAGNISQDNPEDDVEIRQYGLYFDVDNGYVLRTAANVAPESTDGGSSWDLSDESGKSGVSYIVNAGSTESDGLVPGQNFPLDIGVQVPLGVDESRISQGTVTVQASQWQP